MTSDLKALRTFKPMKERHPFAPLFPEDRVRILRENAATLLAQARECERLAGDDKDRFYFRLFALGLEDAIQDSLPSEAAE